MNPRILITRRVFTGVVAGLAAVCAGAAGVPGLLGAIPRGVVEAVRSGKYPGPLKRLRAEQVRQPGKWAG